MVKSKLFNWIGGKKWLSKDLNEIYNDILKNKNVKTYVEPFAGGLGSFLYTLESLKNYNIEKYVLNDVNETIINIYQEIKEDYSNLFEDYWKIEEAYAKTVPVEVFSLHKTKDKEQIKILLLKSRDFYECQKRIFNDLKFKDMKSSLAHFLFLSQHSFNGVYRENSSGGFNTPYNWEAGVLKREDRLNIFKEYNQIFNSINLVFHNKSAFELIDEFKKEKDVMFYLDPPYLNEVIGENKYNKDHFGINEQKILLSKIKEMNNVIFSNHYLDIFKDFCKENNFKYKEVFRSNLINSDPLKRKEKVSEILAYRF